MDDLKLYGKTIQELDSLVQTVRIFSSDTAMQFLERGKGLRSLEECGRIEKTSLGF